jgi:aminopeptidase YwaD
MCNIAFNPPQLTNKVGKSYQKPKLTISMKLFCFVFIIVLFAACAPKFDPEITVEDLKASIEYLASDSLKGRKTGEAGELLAAEYIRSKFENAGLQLLDENGFQPFELVTSAQVGEGNKLVVDGFDYKVEKDFLPYAFSANTGVSATIVFAGYGIEVNIDSLQWDDYKDIDVSGKWVLALQGDPEPEDAESPFIEFSTDRAKALLASDKKAAGLILVAGKSFSETDELEPLIFDKNSSRYSIPILQVTRAVADKILAGTGQTIEKLEAEIEKKNSTINLELAAKVEVAINVLQKETESRNVVAMLPGNDSILKDQYVVVGAHFDHLGMGGPESGSRALDTIAVHNGADDNASGVAEVIELAEKAAGEKSNRRSIIFVCFSGEEMGLIGSNAFTNDPPVPADKMVAMLNFDMVGRLDTTTNALSIGGTQTAKEFESILTDLNNGFDLAMSPEGVGPSDHASFYLQNIPVLFFSTGAHPDYHTPLDDPDRINYEGERKVTEYSYRILMDIANRENTLTFQESGPKYQRSGRGARYKITMGFMPDFAGIEKRGLRVDAITKGKPADLAGMKKGDIITAIEGKKVGGIHDYMNRIQSLEAGQRISIDILRDDKEMVLIVQL